MQKNYSSASEICCEVFSLGHAWQVLMLFIIASEMSVFSASAVLHALYALDAAGAPASVVRGLACDAVPDEHKDAKRTLDITHRQESV